VARTLWQTTRKGSRQGAPATRLTQRHRREAKSAPSLPAQKPALQPRKICLGCGVPVGPGQRYCVPCAVSTSTERLVQIARKGRVIANSPEVQARRAEKTRQHNRDRWGWVASSQPAWLSSEFYERKIQPLLTNVPRAAIMNALGVSKPYAAKVRTGAPLADWPPL
jgi:hypothetical protein